jgi:hypothetical protein
MTLNKEEQIVILFALHSLGGKAKKHRVIHYINQNDLLFQKPDDNKLVSSNESRFGVGQREPEREKTSGHARTWSLENYGRRTAATLQTC